MKKIIYQKIINNSDKNQESINLDDEFKIHHLNLTLISSKFLNKHIEIQLKGFIFNFLNINYIITLHHNLPIENVLYNTNLMDILINSNWSEILILDATNINIVNYKINKFYCNKLPNINTIIYIEELNTRKNYILEVIKYEFLLFDNLQDDYLMPYIVGKFNTPISADILVGMSGSPVYSKEKLIGIFSKYDINLKIAYILPIYIVIKNLTKQDNKNVYTIDTIESPRASCFAEKYTNIKKINSYNVKSNQIYYPIFKLYIPLKTFLLIEGDQNKFITIYYDQSINSSEMLMAKKDLQIIKTNYIINYDLCIDISDNLISHIEKNNYYKISSRFLTLILKIDKNLLLPIFKTIARNTDIKWCSIIYESDEEKK